MEDEPSRQADSEAVDQGEPTPGSETESSPLGGPEATPRHPPQGWYPDNLDPTKQRWWNGSAWTSQIKNTGSESQPPTGVPGSTGGPSKQSTTPNPVDWFKAAEPWKQAVAVGALLVALFALYMGVHALTQDSEVDKCVNAAVAEWESLGNQNSDEVEDGFRELCEAEQEDDSDPGSLNQPYEHQEFTPGSRKIG